jgi:hypothetical protein
MGVAILVYAPDRPVVREDGGSAKTGDERPVGRRVRDMRPKKQRAPHYRLKSEINVKLSKAKVPTNKKLSTVIFLHRAILCW